MQITITRTELEVARRALRAAILLGDTYFTFCPDVSCAGAKVHFATGNHKLEVEMSECAQGLLKRLTAIACPETVYDRKALMRELDAKFSKKNKVEDPFQMALELWT